MQNNRCVRASFFLLYLCPFLTLLFSAGCRNCEIVETALRMREQDLLMMREELLQKEFHIQALQREIYDMRRHAPTPAMRMPAEVASQTYLLRRVTLGRSTGGLDDDGQPGDEALQVVIEPRDLNDDIIKAPGSVEITALEISPEGLKSPIGTWTFTHTELAPKWKQALFTNGYALVLPWQKPPTHEQVRVIVRFQVLDGRLFEADRDVRLRLPPHMPPANGIPMPPGEPLPPPEPVKPAPNGMPLPPPVDPGKKKEGVPFPAPVDPAKPNGDIPLPMPGDGPILQPATSQWRAPSLEGSFRLRRPEPLEPAQPPPPPY